MTTSIKYIGTLDPYFEIAITGKQGVWHKGQVSDVPDADAVLLVGTGLFQNAVSAPGGSTTLGPVADVATLNSTYPAASNAGREALVGASAPYAIYDCNGSAWTLRGSGGGSAPTITSSTVVTATTSATPNDATFVALSAAACNEVLFDNTTGVELELQRSGQTAVISLPPGFVRLVRGLTNASQMGVRRADYALAGNIRTSTISPIARTNSVGATFVASLALTLGNSPSALPSQACTAVEMFNYTGKKLGWRKGSSGAFAEIAMGATVQVSGITNAAEIQVQPYDSNSRVVRPLQIECYNSALTDSRENTRPITALSAESMIYMGEQIFADAMPLQPLRVGLGQLRPHRSMRKKGLVNLLRIDTVANLISNRAADCADVTTGEIAWGASVVEYTQTQTAEAFFAAGSALSVPVDVTGGAIHVRAAWPAGTPNFATSSALDGVRIYLYSSGSPSAPSSNYHMAYLSNSASDTKIGEWRFISENGLIYGHGVPISYFTNVGGSGANLNAITYARISIDGATAGNGAKWRPISVDYVPAAMNKGVVMFRLDDIYESAFTRVLPILSKYGYPAFLGVDTCAKIGQSGFLSAAQIHELVNRHGWQACYQVFRQEVFFDQTPEQWQRSVNQHLLTMAAIGVGTTEDGTFGTATYSNMSDERQPLARRIFRSMLRGKNGKNSSPALDYCETLPFADPHSVKGLLVSSGFTAGTIYTRLAEMVDKAVAEKGCITFVAHDDFATVGSEMHTALIQLVDYIRSLEVAGTVEVHTPESIIGKVYYS